MDCVMQMDLVSYYFGAVDDDVREKVDAHLLECTSCLRSYLVLKHHVERGSELRPGDAAKKRLRDAVYREVRPRPARRIQRALSRPIPLYQGLAVAAVLLLLATVGPTLLASSRGAPQADHGERVDTSRPVAQGPSVY